MPHTNQYTLARTHMDAYEITRRFRPDIRQIVTYQDDQGYPQRGVWLEPPNPDHANPTMYVGTYTQPIPTHQVIAIHDTQQTWVVNHAHAH